MRLLERKKLNIQDGTYNPPRRVSFLGENGLPLEQNIDELDEIDFELQMIN